MKAFKDLKPGDLIYYCFQWKTPLCKYEILSITKDKYNPDRILFYVRGITEFYIPIDKEFMNNFILPGGDCSCIEGVLKRVSEWE